MDVMRFIITLFSSYMLTEDEWIYDPSDPQRSRLQMIKTIKDQTGFSIRQAKACTDIFFGIHGDRFAFTVSVEDLMVVKFIMMTTDVDLSLIKSNFTWVANN